MRTLAITGNRDGVHDFANDLDAGHARDAAFFANVGRNALERHDGAGAGLFGDLGLLGVGDVHDDAALEHFGQADFYAPGVFADEIGAIADALLAEPPFALCALPLPFAFFPFDFFASIVILLVNFQIRFQTSISKSLLLTTKLFKNGHGVPCPYALLDQSDAAAFRAADSALALAHFDLQQVGESLNASRDLLLI